MPDTLSTLYCSSDDVDALLSQEGVDLRLDDDESDAISATEETRLTTWALNYATSRVNDYALGRYLAANLDNNWTVNHWATVIAARYLCVRRGNPLPKSIAELYKEVMADLKALKAGEYQLGDIAERVLNSPSWSNLRHDGRYLRKKTRKESQMSERTPDRVPAAKDIPGEVIAPLENY